MKGFWCDEQNIKMRKQKKRSDELSPNLFESKMYALFTVPYNMHKHNYH